jgi:dihydropteroate synthase
MSPASFATWLSSPRRRCLIMGVLNVTPDSFSDGGQFASVEQAIDHAKRMIDDGADLIDVGGESTRPGAARVDAPEQVRRVAPVIQRIGQLGVTISVDTTRASVAAASLDAGATVVNDVSACREDAEMIPLVARRGCPVALMHMQGSPGTMQANPTYADVVAEVRDQLLARAQALRDAGVERSRILLDPGIGFGKTVEHNLRLLRHLDQLVSTGYPILVGTSRKSFIGKLLSQPNASDRLMGTAASVAWSVAHGAGVVRVHDVDEMRQVVRLIEAIAEA